MIPELPDDILTSVVLLLPLKEAGTTSVLSKRCRYMWAYNHILNFHYGEEYVWFLMDAKTRAVEGTKYFNWVNQVVDSHKAPTIDEFRVRFDISSVDGTCNIGNSIDNWFRFAMEKGVKRLEIDLSLWCRLLHKERYHNFANFAHLPLCNNLTSLELGCVNVSGEILESFLCKCQALESLSVKFSNSLVNVKVSGPSLSLKHLAIYDCHEIRKLEISAPNLESVYYRGQKIDVQFKGTPKLIEARFGYDYARDLLNICSDLSSCVSQIKVLILDSASMRRVVRLPLLLVKWDRRHRLSVDEVLFKRLVKLDVLARRNKKDLYYFASLIHACPSLQHFKVRLFPSAIDSSACEIREQRKINPCYHLKIVEIVGFIGSPIELKFIDYLMENVASIGKLIVDTRNVLGKGGPGEFKETEERRQGRECAELLRSLKFITKLEIV